MIKRLRQFSGTHLIAFGIRVYGPKVPEQTTHEVSRTLDIPTDAVVESSEIDPQWSPEQHGNVVIVEPMMISKHRRGKL